MPMLTVGPFPPPRPLALTVENILEEPSSLTLSGLVTQPEGSPYDLDETGSVAGAILYIRGGGVMTDVDGRFTLDNLALSDTLRIQFVGYCGITKTVAKLVSARYEQAPCPAR